MPSVSGCIPSGSRYSNIPNELVHRAGPPFLDNHYRGNQCGSHGFSSGDVCAVHWYLVDDLFHHF